MSDPESLHQRVEQLEERMKQLEEGIEVAVNYLGGDIANVRAETREHLAALVRLLLELHVIDVAAARRAGLPLPSSN